MKKVVLLLIATFATTVLLSSCNDSDGDYASNQTIATVKTLEGGGYYFLLDNNETALPGDTRRIGSYTAKEDQRAILLFNYLKNPTDGYDYNIALYAIADILTKEPKTIASQEELDKIGNDGINICRYYERDQIWIGGGYLNIMFSLVAESGSKHELNLIDNQVEAPSQSIDGYTSLDFRHNANGTKIGYYREGYVSFRLGDLDPAISGSKGLHIRIKTTSGDIKYYKVEAPTEE